VDAVLTAIDASAKNMLWPYRSVLIPMLGTGEGGFQVHDVAPRMVDRAVAYLERNRKSVIREIYFVAYSLEDREVLHHVLESSEKLESGAPDASS
jgi:O-acetyl-ADP-ribose deacetylase (regulator of RNase III)